MRFEPGGRCLSVLGHRWNTKVASRQDKNVRPSMRLRHGVPRQRQHSQMAVLLDTVGSVAVSDEQNRLFG